MIDKKTVKKFLEIQKSDKKERKTYVETMIFFMIFMLTLLVVIITGTGVSSPSFISLEALTPILTDLLMLFIIAELLIVIMLLHRMAQN